MIVRRLFISPGHNFFGHHGQAPGRHPAVEVDRIECVAGRGVRGDRFFDYKPDYRGQITFFSLEVLAALGAALGRSDPPAAGTRRNVMIEGADLNQLVGREFELQGVRFHGSSECAPCHWMDQMFGAGAEQFLQHQGGLRARILTDGCLRVEA